MFSIGFAPTRLFLILLIIQMFLLPAIIVMVIAATRMHRTLSDFAYSRYCAAPFHSVLMPTFAAVVVLSILIRLGGGTRRIQIPGHSQRQLRSNEWRWPCTRLPRTIL